MHSERTASRGRIGRSASRTTLLLALAAAAVSLTAGCGDAKPTAAAAVPTPAAVSSEVPTTAPSVAAPAAAPSAVARPAGAGTDGSGSAGSAPVQPAAAATKPAVPLTALADFGTGVTAKIAGSRLVTSDGKGPGEIAGQPSVAFTVALTNNSGKAVDLTNVTVSAYYGAQSTPASPTNGAPTAPFHGNLAKGAATSGTYTFLVPPEGRGDVQLQISYLADQPTVVLRGAVP